MPKIACLSAYTCEDLDERVRQHRKFTPTLGIVFGSPALGIPGLAEASAEWGFPVFGSSTAGEILKGESGSQTLEQSAVCCLTDLDSSLFSVSIFEKGAASFSDFGRTIAQWGLRLFEAPAFIIAISGLSNDGEAIVKGIQSACPSGTPIYGGLSGDDSNFKETFVFSHNGLSTNGAVAIVLDTRRVSIHGIATSGWTGVGVEMVVTSSEGNIVHTINDRSAVDLYREYLNISPSELVQIGVTFPLLVKRPDGNTVLRAVMAADFSTGSLIFAGSVPSGSRVMFSSSFGYEIIEKSIREINDLYHDHPDAFLIMAFSCIARHSVFGDAVDDEIKAASDLWHAPLIGFFTYGEIGPGSTGVCDFHNETLSLVLIDILPTRP